MLGSTLLGGWPGAGQHALLIDRVDTSLGVHGIYSVPMKALRFNHLSKTRNPEIDLDRYQIDTMETG